MTVAEPFAVVELFTSEEARWKGHPLYEEVVHFIARQEKGARCLVTRAIAGCHEDGQIATHRVLDLSYNMPVKIEILLPPAEVDSAVAELRRMAPDAVILVRGEPHASA